MFGGHTFPGGMHYCNTGAILGHLREFPISLIAFNFHTQEDRGFVLLNDLKTAIGQR